MRSPILHVDATVHAGPERESTARYLELEIVAELLPQQVDQQISSCVKRATCAQ
jgi:hypothetical protein